MGHYGVSQGWSFLVENGYVAIPILAPRTSPSTSVLRQQRPYPQQLGVVLYAACNASRPRVIRKCHNHVNDASTPTGSEIGRLHPSCVQSPNPNTKRQRQHSDLRQYAGRADRNPQSRSPLTSRHHERTAYKPSAPRSLAITKLVM